MATGASNASLAVMLVDARKGVLTQTQRHSTICSLLGIRHVVLAVNKMDLVGFDEAVFERIVGDYGGFAGRLGFRSMVPMPICARFGDNVTTRSGNTPWYHGPTLLEHLETVDVAADAIEKPFRFPVQWVNRPNLDFRGFSGTVASGRVAVGEKRGGRCVRAKATRVARIVTGDGDLPAATAGDAVTSDAGGRGRLSRGDVLVPPAERPEVADQFAAHLLWMDEEADAARPALPHAHRQSLDRGLRHLHPPPAGREHAGRAAGAPAGAERDRLLQPLRGASACRSMPYAENRATGAFILVDRVHQPHRRRRAWSPFRCAAPPTSTRKSFLVDKAARARLVGQRPLVLWFTGLSGSGKSTIAKLVEQALHARRAPHLLAWTATTSATASTATSASPTRTGSRTSAASARWRKLFVDAGLIVLCSFISPFRAERRMVRELMAPGEFVEVFVDTPIEECMRARPEGALRQGAGRADPELHRHRQPLRAIPRRRSCTCAPPAAHRRNRRPRCWTGCRGAACRSECDRRS